MALDNRINTGSSALCQWPRIHWDVDATSQYQVNKWVFFPVKFPNIIYNAGIVGFETPYGTNIVHSCIFNANLNAGQVVIYGLNNVNFSELNVYMQGISIGA